METLGGVKNAVSIFRIRTFDSNDEKALTLVKKSIGFYLFFLG